MNKLAITIYVVGIINAFCLIVIAGCLKDICREMKRRSKK